MSDDKEKALVRLMLREGAARDIESLRAFHARGGGAALAPRPVVHNKRGKVVPFEAPDLTPAERVALAKDAAAQGVRLVLVPAAELALVASAQRSLFCPDGPKDDCDGAAPGTGYGCGQPRRRYNGGWAALASVVAPYGASVLCRGYQGHGPWLAPEPEETDDPEGLFDTDAKRLRALRAALAVAEVFGTLSPAGCEAMQKMIAPALADARARVKACEASLANVSDAGVPREVQALAAELALAHAIASDPARAAGERKQARETIEALNLELEPHRAVMSAVFADAFDALQEAREALLDVQRDMNAAKLAAKVLKYRPTWPVERAALAALVKQRSEGIERSERTAKRRRERTITLGAYRRGL